MAMESSPLLDTLIAWTSSHLSLFHDSFEVRALEDRSSALAAFAASLSTAEILPELSLAGCLVFCSMEAILGDTAGWYAHLVGASHIIKRTYACTSSSSSCTGIDTLSRTMEGRWLLRNFAYHDILMSVSSNCAPLIPGHYWLSDNDNVVDSYFGVASEPMAHLSTISSLNAEMMEYGASDGRRLASSLPQHDFGTYQSATTMQGLSSSSFSIKAFHIEGQLQAWNCAPSPDSSLMLLAETYRSAALIHLYRVMRRYDPSYMHILNQKIRRQVDTIVVNVSEMPMECLPECTLLFPLFLAGGEAEDERHIQYIRYRLGCLGKFRHFRNVDVALEILERLWAERKGSRTSNRGLARAPDWLDILEESGWKLALS